MQQKPPNSAVRKRHRTSKCWQRVVRPIALPLLWLVERLTGGLTGRLGRGRKTLLITLLLWGLAGLLLHQIVVQMQANSDQADFETAYRSIVQLSETALESSPPVLRSQSQYGISQDLYDRWRQSQDQPIQDITSLSETEAKALYHDFWQQGQCNQYAPPLDLACLDTRISFDAKLSQSFLAALPPDPSAAAIAVSHRRTAYHERALERLIPNLSANAPLNERLRHDRLAQIAGLQRDRALIKLAQTGAGTIAAQPPDSWQLPDQRSPDQSSPDQSSPTAPQPTQPSIALSTRQISAKADLFTAEVWIKLEDGSHAPAAGIILSADGLILTNAHVVERNSNPTIHIRNQANDQQNEQQYPGQTIAVDRQLDLALVQASGASNLTVAPLAQTTAQVKTGDTVYAIGSPEGKHWTLTTAQVLAVQSPCGLPSLKCIRSPKGFLEPGNSGGPLLDQSGTVIGINRALQESTGEGVSIPVEAIQYFLEKVKR